MKCRRLKISGLMGSLRWWYEALIRGTGGTACDPAGDQNQRCSLDYNAFQDSLRSGDVVQKALEQQGICSACRVFGCTSWARTFKVAILQSNLADDAFQGGPVLVQNRKNARGQAPMWYFRPSGRQGSAELEFVPLRPIPIDPRLWLSLAVATRWGAIGARTQLGYGVVEWINIEEFYGLFRQAIQHFDLPQPTSLPSVREMFFCRLSISQGFSNEKARIQKALEIKFDLREQFRQASLFTSLQGSLDNLRHFMMGHVVPNTQIRSGSHIYVSRVYKVEDVNEVRIWGWVPKQIPHLSVNRDEVLKAIYTKLAGYGYSMVWREFDSSRDTMNKFSDIAEFVKSLVWKRSSA